MHLHTNIDCAQRHVSNYSNTFADKDYPILVGDQIEFELGKHHQTHMIMYFKLKVCARTWRRGELYIELSLGSCYENITALEKWIRTWNEPMHDNHVMILKNIRDGKDDLLHKEWAHNEHPDSEIQPTKPWPRK